MAQGGAVSPLGAGASPAMDAQAQAAADHLLRRFLGPDNKFGAIHLIELPVPVDEEEARRRKMKQMMVRRR